MPDARTVDRNTDNFLLGGGEMGAIIRAYDWDSTALGPPSSWPQGLRTSVRLLLSTEHPMFIWWGPELLQFYNDAYRRSIGPERHPSAIGERGRDCWAEIWPIIGPQIEQVMGGRGSTWQENQLVPITRNGQREDVYWTYSYSPIDDPGAPNGVGGVLVVCAETTETVLSHRRASEESERLKAMFRQGPSFIALLRGPNHVFELVNDAYGRLIGNRDVVGQPLRAALPEVSGQGFFEIMDAVYQTAEPHVARRSPIMLASGEGGALEEHYLDFVYQPIFDAQGRVDGIFVEGTDVTDYVELESALKFSEGRFHAIVDSIDQMIWSTRPDGYHDFYNQRWYDFTGVPVGSTDGDGWNRMFHPEDQERAWATWSRCLASGEAYRIEYRLRHASGGYRWVLGRAQPVRDEHGRITRWFGTCTDIQEIVEARQVLARSRDELEREVEARTRERDRVWRNSPDLLSILDASGVFQSVNPAWTEILGWNPDQVAGKHHLDFVHPADRPASAAALTHSLREALPSFTNRLLHADGSYRWVSWVASPDGDLVYGIGRHITAEKLAAEQLSEAQEALRQSQKLEAIGQLTGGVAHDFNNLLTVIRSSADLLRRRDLDETRRRRYVDAISDTADRAAKLTAQLLAFARRQALSPEVFDVAERMSAVTDMLRTVLGARIELTLATKLRPALIEADVSQFETAVVNLATNARDAMDGEGALIISVEEAASTPSKAASAQGFVSVAVTDSGCGIPPDQLRLVFDPFFTTKGVGRGTGLGLSQVYGFVRQSGGEVTIDSTVGTGTKITLFLPRTDKPLAPADAPPSAIALKGRGAILVVEDNTEVGEFSSQLLSDLGYQATHARDAQAALTLLEQHPDRFDLIFSDVVMPGMDGIALGQEVARRWPGLPFVLTSGYSDVLASQGAHGFELVQKPYSVETLSHVLRRVLVRTERGNDRTM